jgi:hypothetical protein
MQPRRIGQVLASRWLTGFACRKAAGRRRCCRKDDAALKQKAAIQKTTACNWRQIAI